MSASVGKYRKLFARIWIHPGFRTLSKNEQLLALYILCGTQINRIGLCRFSISTAAEDLDVTPETVKKGLANVTGTFGWTFDSVAKVLWIPSWWRWNQPENPNVVRGNLKDLNEVPPCSLVDAFAANVTYLDSTPPKEGKSILETFVECLPKHLPQGSPTCTVLYSSIQNKAVQAGGSRPNKERAGEGSESIGASAAITDNKLVAIAERVINQTPNTANLDYKVDCFLELCRVNNITDANRVTAIAAISQVGARGVA